MKTVFAVVGSNLTVIYFEEKMFATLPQIWDKVFKSGLSKFFKDCLPKI